MSFKTESGRLISTVMRGLDPRIHLNIHRRMDHRVSALRAGPVMTPN
jgi:hypothetical protein